MQLVRTGAGVLNNVAWTMSSIIDTAVLILTVVASCFSYYAHLYVLFRLFGHATMYEPM